jgi:hypothetical protein
LAEGFKGSMVGAIAKAIFDCPWADRIDDFVMDPSLWVENVNLPDSMTSIIIQIAEELDRLNQEWVQAEREQGRRVKLRKLPGFVKGAQSDKAAIEVVTTLWADPLNPQLKFFRGCKGLITEMEDLKWEEWSDMQQEKRSLRETVQDKDNHSWDDLKYYIMSRHEGPRRKKPRQEWGSGEWMAEQLRRDGV